MHDGKEFYQMRLHSEKTRQINLIYNLFDSKIKRKSSGLDFTVKLCLDLTIDLKSIVKSIIDSTLCWLGQLHVKV